MTLWAHAATAAPFLLVGDLPAAVGCVLPDLSLAAVELAFRRSGIAEYAVFIAQVPAGSLVLYRLAHSLLVLGAVLVLLLMLGHGATFCIGWGVHLVLDLPTHRGRMRQQPLYPLKWRWPWAL